MIAAAENFQNMYLNTKTELEKKNLGQYFTGGLICEYMASMIRNMDEKTVRVLDAGAGVGILTITAAFQLMRLGCRQVHAVLYEIDCKAIAQLKINMEQVARRFLSQGGKFTYDIRLEDFVLSRPDKTESPFHLSLINPPYFKYNSKTSPYGSATGDLFKGNPNIYASFMAVVAACVGRNGQMIAIVPRSFTAGLYFKGFRHYLNQSMSLDKLHIFRSRNKVFKDLSVLQETIICSYTKRYQVKEIEISSSNDCQDLNHIETQCYPAKLIIDITNEHKNIRIPESIKDARILRSVQNWPSSFHKNGYYISTGPIVEHRIREYIVSSDKKVESIPLLRMHNVKIFQTTWTGNNKKDVRFHICIGHEKYTLKNQPYVLLKRFSSKEEKRRLVAAVHEPKEIKGEILALENHLNYIGHKDGALDRAEAYGLAALFNSTFMDRYFRSISGSTQVNATEIRLLKLPTRDIICQMGLSFLEEPKTEQIHIDRIIEFHLNVKELAVA